MLGWFTITTAWGYLQRAWFLMTLSLKRQNIPKLSLTLFSPGLLEQKPTWNGWNIKRCRIFFFCLIWKSTAKLEPALASREKPLNAFVTRLQSASPCLWHYRAQQWPLALSATWVFRIHFLHKDKKPKPTNSEMNREIEKRKGMGKKMNVQGCILNSGMDWTPQPIKALWMT